MTSDQYNQNYTTSLDGAVVISGANADNFSVTSQPTSPIVSSGSSTFTIVFDPTAAGRRVAFVSIANDDVNENPYRFTISGFAQGYPEIDVQGQGISILDGGATASPSDDTDFGNVGLRSANVSIKNDDSNENPYNFTIQGVGLGPSISSVTRAGASSSTNAATVDFTVTFSESVSGVDASDFALTSAPGLTGVSIASVNTSDNTTYTVTVNTGSGVGSLRPDVVDDDSIQNSVGQKLGGTGPDGDFTSGESYDIDKIAPKVVSSLCVDACSISLSIVHYGVHFSEAVSGAVNRNGATFQLAVIRSTC